MSEPDAVSFEPVTSGSRLALVIVVAVLVTAAAAVLAIVLTGIGAGDGSVVAGAVPAADDADVLDDGLDDDGLEVPGDEPLDDPDETDEDDGVGTLVPVTTHEVFLARDPFDPVVPSDIEDLREAAADADPDAPTDPGDAPTAPDDPDAPDAPDAPADPSDPRLPADPDDSPAPTDPADPSLPSPLAGPDDPRCVGEHELVCNGQVVTLVDVTTDDGEDVAVIQVDTTVYEVQRGQVFATHYQLRAIDGQCISLLYGDDGFRLCSGETVLK